MFRVLSVIFESMFHSEFGVVVGITTFKFKGVVQQYKKVSAPEKKSEKETQKELNKKEKKYIHMSTHQKENLVEKLRSLAN